MWFYVFLTFYNHCYSCNRSGNNWKFELIYRLPHIGHVIPSLQLMRLFVCESVCSAEDQTNGSILIKFGVSVYNICQSLFHSFQFNFIWLQYCCFFINWYKCIERIFFFNIENKLQIQCWSLHVLTLTVLN